MTWNSSQMPLPPSMSRASRAMASAFPHEFRFSIDTASGAALRGRGQGQRRCHPPCQPPPPVRRHPPALVLEAPEAQAGLQPQRDLRHHVRQLLLHQLVARQRPPELLPAAQSGALGTLRGVAPGGTPPPRHPAGAALPVEDVLPRRLQTGLGGPQRTPGDAVPGLVEAAEGALGRAGVTGDTVPRRGAPPPPAGPTPPLLTASPTALGSRFSSGTSTSSSTIMPVAEARSENLPSMRGVLSPGVPRSTRKPRTRPSSSHTAHTRHRSATGELVILAGVGMGGGAVRGRAGGVPAPRRPPRSGAHQVLVPRSV